MEQPEALANLLAEAYFGETGRTDGITWYGPSVRRVLDEVLRPAATWRPPAGHSIWELALHIAVWDEICATSSHGSGGA